MNETIKTMLEHTTIRNFNEQPISTQQQDLIIECAMRAPSAGNLQAYSIIKVTDQNLLDALAKSCDNQPLIANAQFALIFLIDANRIVRYFAQSGVTYDDGRAIKPTLTDVLLGAQDSVIAAQNASLAAESMGIGTCYIGDIIENVAEHRELLNLPEAVIPFSMLVFGNYDKKPDLRERFAKEYMVYENHYQKPNVMEMYAIKDRDNKFAQKIYNRKWGQPFFQNMTDSFYEYLKDFGIEEL